MKRNNIQTAARWMIKKIPNTPERLGVYRQLGRAQDKKTFIFLFDEFIDIDLYKNDNNKIQFTTS